MGKRIVVANIVAVILKYFFLMALVVLIGVKSAAVFVEKYYSKKAEKPLSELADATKSAIDLYIEKRIKDLTRIAQEKNLQDILTANPDKQSIKKFVEQQPAITFFKDIFISTAEGNVIFDYYDRILKAKETTLKGFLPTSLNVVRILKLPYVSEFDYYPPYYREPVLFVSVPVIINNVFFGILGARIDTEDLFATINDYSKLGKTGDIIIGKRSDINALVIFPTRYNRSAAFSMQVPLSDEHSPLVRAVTGAVGKGIMRDAEKNRVVAIWQYLPQLDWGVVIQQQLRELIPFLVLQENIFWFVFFMLSLLTFLLWAPTIHRILPPRLKEFFYKLQTIVALCLLISVLFFGYRYYSYLHLRSTAARAIQADITHKLRRAAQQLDHELYQVEAVANSIALDLTSQKLKYEDINIRLKRDVEENSSILGIIVAFRPNQFEATKKLYAPSFIRIGNKIESKDIASLYDYTTPETPGTPSKQWYADATSASGIWTNVFVEPISKLPAVAFSLPFYTVRVGGAKEEVGVISVLYPVHNIKKIVSSFAMPGGYVFVMNAQTQALYHPIEDYVMTGQKLLELAKKDNNQPFRLVLEQILQSGFGTLQYADEISKQDTYVLFDEVPKTKWYVGAVLPKGDASAAANKMRHAQFMLFITLVIMLVFFFIFIKQIVAVFRAQYAGLVFVISLILLSGIVAIWRVAQQSFLQEAFEGKTIIDDSNLKNFTERLAQEAQRTSGNTPIFIETGIRINFINFVSPRSITITGQVWQRYKKGIHDQLERGVSFPQTIKMSMEKAYTWTSETDEVIGWDINGELFQQLNYEKFPFDIQRISIYLEPKDRTHSILLIPDLAAYLNMNPTLLPGINKGIAISGYGLEKSFFDFQEHRALELVDAGASVKSIDKLQLTYNILLKRDPLNPLVAYFLPLFVILIALYVILWLTGRRGALSPEALKKEAISVIGSYTALLFTIILIHRALREEFQTGQFLYIEYLFLFTYVTILLLQILTIIRLLFKETQRMILFNVLKILYWPIQFAVWFLISISIFYT